MKQRGKKSYFIVNNVKEKGNITQSIYWLNFYFKNSFSIAINSVPLSIQEKKGQVELSIHLVIYLHCCWCMQVLIAIHQQAA